MTRPLTEDSPGKQQANYGYRIRQLERRPAPPNDPVDIVHLFTWNYDSDNTVPDQTWFSICNFGLGRGFFEESYHVGTWAFNYDDGTVSTSIPAEYQVSGWVQFADDANDGEQRIVAVCRTSVSDRYLNSFTFQTDSVGEGQSKLAAAATPIILGSGNLDVFLAVWHNHGSPIAINDAEIAVYRIRPVSDDNYEARP